MASKSWVPLSLLLVAACGGGGGPAATDAATKAKIDSLSKDSTSAATAKASAAAATKAGKIRHAIFDTAAAGGKRPLVRETYAYEGSARDPFKSVVELAVQGPELPDLKLVMITFDHNEPTRSMATFRENGTNRSYTWHLGERFGRISVVSMTETDVELRMDDFGTPRKQTYTLRKPEDGKP